MVPMLLAGPDIVIIIVVVLLLFGGTRLAGLGKSAGRALREFKEETTDLLPKDAKDSKVAPTEDAATAAADPAKTSERPPVAH